MSTDLSSLLTVRRCAVRYSPSLPQRCVLQLSGDEGLQRRDVAEVQANDVPHLLHKERVSGELVAVRLPLSGTLSAGETAASRSAASGEPWTWRSL